MAFAGIGGGGKAAGGQGAKGLYYSRRQRGYIADDLLGRAPNNMGWVGGKPYVTDPGFIYPETQLNGAQAAVPTSPNIPPSWKLTADQQGILNNRFANPLATQSE